MAQTLKVLAVGDPAVSAYCDPRYGIISGYEKLSGVKVVFDIIPWANYYGTMMEAFEGKRNYDIVMVAGHLWMRDFIDKGYISQVYYPEDDIYDKDDILPFIRQEMEFRGKTYLYPSFCDGHMLLYRKSAVKEKTGCTPESTITTDELISLVKTMHGTNGMSGIALKAHPSEIFLDALPYLRSEGISVFDNDTHLPDFNNQKGAAGLEKYLSLRRYAPEGTGNYGNEEICRSFQKRRVVFAVTWGGQLGCVMNSECEQPEDVGFATLKTPWNVTWSFAVNACSKKMEGANNLLAYLSSKPVDCIVGSCAGSPVRLSTYEKDGGKHPWYNTHLLMIRDYASPLPNMANAGEKLGHMYQQIAEAFNDCKTAAQALADADTDICKIDNAAIRKTDEGKG